MKLGTSTTHDPATMHEDARTRNTHMALRHLTRKAQALGVDVTPDDVTHQSDGDGEISHDHYSMVVQLVPDKALEAAGRAFYDRIERAERARAKGSGTAFHWTPWEHMDRLHRATIIREAQEIVEAAYKATRAHQLRKFADELEAALETGDSPHQLPYDWRDDANLLDGKP